MLKDMIIEVRNDPFTQKWLTGTRFRLNLIVAFGILAVSMHLSLKLLANYDNWKLPSVIIQFASLFAPLACALAYNSAKQIQSYYVRKIVLLILSVISLIGILLVGFSMGLLARGEQSLDPFGIIITLYGISAFVYFMRLF